MNVPPSPSPSFPPTGTSKVEGYSTHGLAALEDAIETHAKELSRRAAHRAEQLGADTISASHVEDAGRSLASFSEGSTIARVFQAVAALVAGIAMQEVFDQALSKSPDSRALLIAALVALVTVVVTVVSIVRED